MANSTAKTTSTVTAVKGHLVTKSSALAATGSCKLESQFITAQNMASHYKRVINAKPSIDTLPPKSMIKSQKARDRAKREILNMSTSSAKPLSRTKSVDSLRNSQSITDSQQTTDAKQSAFTPRVVKSARGYVEIDTKPRTLPDREKLNRSMSNLMSNFTLNSKPRVSNYRPGSTNRLSNENNEQSESTNKNLVTSRSLQSNNSNARNALSALLFNVQNSNDDFNKTKMLHPALKAMSRLASNRNYDVLDNHADRFKKPDKEFEPRIKNTNSESHLGKNPSCYQAPRRRRRKQQQQEPQIQNKSNESLIKPSINNSNISFRDNDDDYDEEEEDTETNQDNENDFRIIKKSSKRLIKEDDLNTKSFIEKQNEMKTAAEKEEQLKYLEFIKEVTNDIIARGISSNRVINNCFENHIKKNKDVLNETKMRELLVTLRKDIGIKDEQEQENLETKENYHQTINKALNINKKTQDLNTSGGSEYLTLQKFGWSNDETNKIKPQNETIIINNNNNKSILRKKSDESVMSQQSRNSSSRRGSNKSQDSTTNNIGNNKDALNNSKTTIKTENKENNNPHVELKQSSKTPSDSSRKNSNSSVNSIRKSVPHQDLNMTHSVETTKHSNVQEDYDDDDDDVFSGNYDTPVKTTNKIYHEPTSTKTKIVRSENSDIQDIQFDDNYGSDNDDDDDEEDDFNKLMKTKKVNNIRKKSNESNHSLNSNDSKQTPKPVPRKINQSNRKESDDDDDDDDEF